MLDFCPQDPGAKETGRASQLKASGLRYKEAAPFFTEATPNNFQRHYNAFIERFPKQAKSISNYRTNGIGPGEMVAWFLFDNVTVGGPNAACDLTVGDADFAEMKAGRYCKSHHSLDDFKLSRDQDPSVSYVVRALSQNESAVTIGHDGVARNASGNVLAAYNTPEFCQQVERIITEKQKTTVDSLYRQHIIEEWKQQIFCEYLMGKKIAMVQTDNLRMRYFGELTKDMVGLYRIHRNQPWARVFLPTAEVY